MLIMASMQEIEVKILEQSHKDWHDRLIALGAKKIFDATMRIAMFKPTHPSHSVLRLREEGNENFLNIKGAPYSSTEVKSHPETEVSVGEFDASVACFLKMGFLPKRKNLIDTKHRVSYRLDNVRIEFDKQLGDWDFVPEYMELEAKSEDDLFAVLSKLNISKDNALPWTGGDVRRLYTKE